MEFLSALWMPILLSAVAVFLVSSLLHMVLPLHRSDYGPLEGEDEILRVMREQGVRPGDYMFPACTSMKEMQSEEMQEKMRRGPVGMMSVLPNGPFPMGAAMLQWFLYTVVVAAFAGYLGWISDAGAAGGPGVFRVTASAGILGFAFWHVPVSIWKGVRWSVTGKFVLDGVIYGLATGAVFHGLWPG